MTVYVEDTDFTLHVGDALETLRGLPDESVHCCVTSPPYLGLRDYGHEDQIGLEPTIGEYVSSLVAVFAEVRRVLRDDGTLWLNLGDSYNAYNGGAGPDSKLSKIQTEARPRLASGFGLQQKELKPKDLMGIPWRVAFALQADGWYLRSDIIWSKPNPMPESVTDRPTKAHEFVFLLTKGEWKGPAKGRFCDLSESDKRWLALLVDAEGNICVKRVAPKEGKSPQYGAQVAIGSTSRALLERVQQIAGCGNVNERPGTNAPMFYWQASNKVARDLLYAIYPHLIVKPRQARIAMHLESLLYHRGNATMRTERENAALESLWTRNKDCNQFGDPDLSDVPEPRYGRWGPTKYFYDAGAIREAAEWARWGDQTNGKHEGSGSAAGWIGSKSKDELSARASVPEGADPKAYAEVAGDPIADLTFFHAEQTERRERIKTKKPDGWDTGPGGHGTVHRSGREKGAENFAEARGPNRSSVWEIATEPYPDAHFATFPQALVEPCILAGTSEHGCCPECGAPWERQTEVESSWRSRSENGATRGNLAPERLVGAGTQRAVHGAGISHDLDSRRREFKGWRPTCGHEYPGGIGGPFVNVPVPCTVLDPFIGSGTTALVARRLGRKTIGIELSAEYAHLAARRLQQLSLFAEAQKPDA